MMACDLTPRTNGLARLILLAFCALSFVSVQAQMPVLAGKAGAMSTPAPALAAATAPAKTEKAAVTAASAMAPAEPAQMRSQPTLKTHPMGDHGDYSGDFASEAPSAQTTHLVTGRSMFIDTKHRLARVYVTNPEILDSFTSSPNQVVITAKKPGMSTLILWDETGEARTYQISSDLNVEMLGDSIRKSMPEANVQVQANENRVILTGTVSSVANGEAVVKMATLYTKDVMNSLVVNSAGVKQVRLEVRIVEVDRSKMSSFAFNFFSNGGNNLASTTTGQYQSTMSVMSGGVTGGKQVTIGNPLNFSLYSSKLNIGATLQDLETMQVLQILAEPTITTMSGEKANFLAGGEFPFPVVQGASTDGDDHQHPVPAIWRKGGVYSVRESRWNGGAEGGAGGERAGLHQRREHRRLYDSRALHATRRDRRCGSGRPDVRHLGTAGSPHDRPLFEDAGHRQRADPGAAVQVQGRDALR